MPFEQCHRLRPIARALVSAAQRQHLPAHFRAGDAAATVATNRGEPTNLTDIGTGALSTCEPAGAWPLDDAVDDLRPGRTDGHDAAQPEHDQ